MILGEHYKSCQYASDTTPLTERMMDRRLPEALISSDDFSELTARQKIGFEANLGYIDRIVKDLDEWRTNDQPEMTPKHFFNELELDVMTILSLPDTDKGTSAWLIHSTWTDDVALPSLGQQLSPEVISAVDSAFPKIEATHGDYKKWLHGQGEGLKHCLDLFYSSTKRDSAIAYLIATDVILANILAGLIRFRLAVS